MADKGLEEVPESQIESNYDEVTDSFDNMNLKAELLRGVYAYGFERPSAIQQRAIMPIIRGEYLRLCRLSKRLLTFKFRIRCHRAGAIRHWKDRYLLYFCPAKNRPCAEVMPGFDLGSHPRVGPTNPESGCCHWRFHEYRVSRMYRRYQRSR